MRRYGLVFLSLFSLFYKGALFASPHVIENFADFWNKETPPFLFVCINFIIYVTVIYLAARKPVRQYFLQRHQMMRVSSIRSKEIFDEAKAKFDSAEIKSAELQSVVKGLKEDMMKQVSQDLDKRKQEMQDGLNRISKDLQAKLSAEKYYAQKGLQVFLAEAAVESARENIITDVSLLAQANDLGLVKDFLERSKITAPEGSL